MRSDMDGTNVERHTGPVKYIIIKLSFYHLIDTFIVVIMQTSVSTIRATPLVAKVWSCVVFLQENHPTFQTGFYTSIHG